jgi:hypothetical protein
MYFYKAFPTGMKVISLILICVLWTAAAGYSHPLHLSFTNLEYKTGGARWELTVKIFSDDFADALRLAQVQVIETESKPDSPEVISRLTDWVGSQLKIWFDGREIPAEKWTLKGWKNKEAAVWMTFIFQEAMPVNEVRITNRLLLDLYPDQKNLFIFTMGQIQSSHEFNGKKREASIILNK